MQPQPFWLVWCPTRSAPTVRQPSYIVAETEAKRLARINPGESFYVLAAVAETYRRWLAGVDVAQEYVGLSATLGRDVRADLGDRLVIGHAVRLGPSGELVVVDAGGVEHELSAGDVTLAREGP